MDCLSIKKDLEKIITGQILVEEPMYKHTTWKVGGPADVMIMTRNAAEISKVMQYARDYGIPLNTIGNGSNLLVMDKGIRGIVLKINKCLDEMQVTDNLIIAGAGAMLPKVARLAISGGLKGLEFAIGIPATVGGAVSLNAGAHGSNISQVVREVKVVNLKGEIENIPAEKLAYNYRNSCLKTGEQIVVEAVFELARGDVEELNKVAKRNLEVRKVNQPLNYPNCGSVFKNPPGNYAGKLIDEAGCKKLRVGRAEVSEKHANFFINLGGATAEELLELINNVREKVKARFNIALELEIQIMGES